MKFFNWVQNKLSAGHGSQPSKNKPPATVSTSSQAKPEDPPAEKFSDWSNGLLTIGTLGNRDQTEAREIQRAQTTISSSENKDDGEIQGSSSPDLTEFTAEEVGRLQKELTRLLKRKKPPPPLNNSIIPKGSSDQDQVVADLPLDRFLNCPSSLEVDRSISNRYSVYSDQYSNEEDNIDRTIKAIISRCKQVCMESKKKKSIGKKSLSFLLKKMFVCATGAAAVPPPPSLRDTLLQETRMEKLLRTMLSKKIYPQNGSRASSIKRYLVDPNGIKAQKDREDEEAQNKDGSIKWVKTDSEYIVLDLD